MTEAESNQGTLEAEASTSSNGADVLSNESLLRRVKKYLSEARDRLVDRNLRNKLINTSLQSTRTTNLRIWGELSDQVFTHLIAEKRSMSFGHVPDTKEPSDDDGNSLFQLDSIEIDLPDDPNRINDSILQTKLTKLGLEKKLRSLYYEAADYEEEQGVNILFLAVGFLKWYEDGNSAIERYAPLILMPVELTREGARERYRLKVRDEDLITNISLKLWLKEQHAIDLPEIPEEDIWRPSSYFASIKKSISNAGRWEVLENEMVLGFFSFSKFLLWRDLDPANWPKGKGILEHKVIQKLLGSAGEAAPVLPEPPIVPENELIDDHFSPHQLVYVLDADSSQTEAIQTSLAGKDLVIQGPPGTGKSQTITNIIAAGLHEGKKILFIAEKLAALDVVHQRLKKTNLAPLCFELHSRKASKSSVLAQLRESLDLAYQPIDPTDRVELLTRNQFLLNEHAKRLNTSIEPWGYRPFEVIGALSKLHREGVQPSIYEIPNASGYSKQSLEDLIHRLLELVERLAISGVPLRHPWRKSTKNALSPLDASRMATYLEELKSVLTHIISNARDIGTSIQIDVLISEDITYKDVRDLIEINEVLKFAPAANCQLLKSPILKQNNLKLSEISEVIRDFKPLSEELNKTLIPGWLTYDFFHLRINFAASGGSFFSIFSKKYRESLGSLKALTVSNLPKDYSGKLKLLDQALLAINLKNKLTSFDKVIADELGDVWLDEDSDTFAIAELADWHKRTSQLSDEQFEVLRRLVGNKPSVDLIDEFQTLLERRDELRKKIYELAEIDEKNSNEANFVNESAVVDGWLGAIDRFNEWPPLRDILNELRPILGEDLSRVIYRGEIQPSEIIPLVQITILEKVWQAIVNRLPSLASLDGHTLNNTLHQFRLLDKERLALASKQVLSAYVRKRPSGFAGDMGIVRQELNKKRNHLPVRKLLEKSGKAIQELKPIFLMSPLSLAQYVAPASLNFDILIIDEASQVKPEDALGAISRAKQIIVVGDDKQLPPTNFFNRLTDDDQNITEDDEDFALSNLESILSLCNIVLPNQCMLRWHYRSHHPGLIAVSNRNFYDSKLLLPPSVLRDSFSEGMGVSMIKSPKNGYERGGANGGRNILEAEMIAQAVIDFAKTCPNQSLGVAAFSVKQRDAIRDLVDNHRQKHPELEEFFSTSRTEPFFIKNLESIQGDERDVIFISVGYGRDQNGRLTQTFGPLGQAGGERRLNVLISRAKTRCTVFSSLTAEDIQPVPGNLGVSAFKEFLQYAEKGYFDVPQPTIKDFDSDFEESVALFLRKNGYELQPQVGMSGFLIDIGVLHPTNKGRFLCGIECDGASYHSSRSARDRDRLRQSILESRGWRIYRIWSTDWFHRRADQEQRLLDYLAELLANKQVLSPVLPAEIEVDIPVFDSDDFSNLVPGEAFEEVGVSEYIEYTEQVNSKLMPHQMSPSQLAVIVRRIVELEGPIHEEEISRRVARVFGLERTGKRILDATKQALRSTNLKKLECFWLVQNSEISVRDRSKVVSRTLLNAVNLPPIEIAEAIKLILSASIRVSADELIQHTSRMLGFSRCGPDIKSAIAKVLDTSPNFIKNDSGLYILSL